VQKWLIIIHRVVLKPDKSINYIEMKSNYCVKSFRVQTVIFLLRSLKYIALLIIQRYKFIRIITLNLKKCNTGPINPINIGFESIIVKNDVNRKKTVLI